MKELSLDAGDVVGLAVTIVGHVDFIADLGDVAATGQLVVRHVDALASLALHVLAAGQGRGEINAHTANLIALVPFEIAPLITDDFHCCKFLSDVIFGVKQICVAAVGALHV